MLAIARSLTHTSLGSGVVPAGVAAVDGVVSEVDVGSGLEQHGWKGGEERVEVGIAGRGDGAGHVTGGVVVVWWSWCRRGCRMFGSGPSTGEGLDPMFCNGCDGAGGRRQDAAAGEGRDGEEEDGDA